MIEWVILLLATFVLLFSGFILGYSVGHGTGREEGFRRGHAAASKWSGRKSDVL